MPLKSELQDLSVNDDCTEHVDAFPQFPLEYRKFPKYLDTQKICCNHSKIWTM